MMAITRSSFATSLLLCSLLVIASANDYRYDSSKTQAYDYGRKPEGEEKPDYGTKPTPKGEEKPEFYKPQPEDYKEKPEPVETEKPDYGTKPVYQPKPAKPDYSTKKNFYKPQPEEKADHYDTEIPDFYPPKPEGEENPDHYNTELPDFYSPKHEVLPIVVQGLVLCKSGPKYYPIQGALARIKCLAVDENGYEKPHSVCSGKTDAKGYFFATLSDPLGLVDEDDQLTKLTECKAFLESSPLETCNVPVDVNKGISGAPLSDFRVLDQKRMKLYSVGPFFFTSEPIPVPSNGY